MTIVDLKVSDVAAELQIDEGSVRLLCRQGKIFSYRLRPADRNSPIRIRRSDLDAFKDKQTSANRWGTRKP